MKKISWEDEDMNWHRVLVKKEIISLSIAFAPISLVSFLLWYFLRDPLQGLPLPVLLVLVLGLYGYSCMAIQSQLKEKDKYEISDGILRIQGPNSAKSEIELKTSVVKSIRQFEGFNVVYIGNSKSKMFYRVYVKQNSPEWIMVCQSLNLADATNSAVEA